MTLESKISTDDIEVLFSKRLIILLMGAGCQYNELFAARQFTSYRNS